MRGAEIVCGKDPFNDELVCGCVLRSLPTRSPQHCVPAARGKSRNTGSESTSDRSNEGSTAWDCGSGIARSFAGLPLQNRNTRGWLWPSTKARIAALPEGQDTRLHCCPGDQSTWQFESCRPANHRSQRQYQRTPDSPGNHHRRRQLNPTSVGIKMLNKKRVVKEFT